MPARSRRRTLTISTTTCAPWTGPNACESSCRSCRRTSAGRRSSTACSARAGDLAKIRSSSPRADPIPRRFALESRALPKTTGMRKLPADPVQELDPDQDPFARESIEALVKRYGAPLFLIDAARVRTQYQSLAAALPRVELFYAVKCLPHASVVATLRDAGASFDLATNGEVELVRCLGVAPVRCIHTHPIKRDSDIRTA